MASEGSAKQSSAVVQSDPPRLRLVLFACGHGDMILAELPGRRWALIDAHLDSDEVKARFFDFLKKERVERLDFVFLTHPHYDHYHGMEQVVAHFTRNGVAIGTFVDIGANPEDIVRLLDTSGQPPDRIEEYVRLMRLLNPLFLSRDIKYEALHEHVLPLDLVGVPSPGRFVPIGPQAGLVSILVREALQGVNVRKRVNGLSLVLLLHLTPTPRDCAVLLAGDSDTEALGTALKWWAEHPSNQSQQVVLDIVKVPHHGSPTGACDTLLACRRATGQSVAGISVGTLHRLPKASVIKGYLNAGWKVIATKSPCAILRQR